MKFKFSMFLFALAAMTFFSCDKEDIVETNTAKMVGDWTPTSVTLSNCADANDNFSATFDANGTACVTEFLIETCVTMTYVYNADGTYSSSIITTIAGLETSNQSDTGTWRVIDATTMEVCSDVSGNCATGTYVVTNTTFTYNGEDANTGCNINFVASK